jgi:hypothetical protein
MRTDPTRSGIDVIAGAHDGNCTCLKRLNALFKRVSDVLSGRMKDLIETFYREHV